jgi:hypothetical protein
MKNLVYLINWLARETIPLEMRALGKLIMGILSLREYCPQSTQSGNGHLLTSHHDGKNSPG